MGQSNGKSTIKRFELVFKGKSYHFTLNPEEYNQVEPNRITVTQTLGGAFIDAFGAGLLEISFKGTTGFKNRTGQPDDGFNKFKELASLIRSVYSSATQGAQVTELLKFYNYTDEEYWDTYPERFALLRSKSKPLLYGYDVRLIGLKKLGSGSGNGGVVGNPYPIANTSRSDVVSPLLKSMVGNAGNSNSYTVVKGDSLVKIGNRIGVSWQELHKANPWIKNPSLIYPGQIINLPK